MKTKIQYLSYIVFFILISNFFIYSQSGPQSYESFDPNSGNIDPDTTFDLNDPNLVYWGETVKDFGLSIGSVDQATLPLEIAFNYSNISSEEDECINEWNTYGCIELSKSDFGIYVGFSTDETIFKNTTQFGAAVEAVIQSNSKYEFSVYPSQTLSNWDFTAIYFNKTTELENNYRWTSTEANVGVDSVPVKPVLLHELGHIIGLGHNSPPQYDMHTVMSYPEVINHFVFNLTQTDKDGLAALCDFEGTPVGVNDYIGVSTDLDHFDVNYLYVGHLNVNFVDVDGDENNDYPINWDNLQIKASYGCGDVLAYNAQGFDFEIPSLPNGYNWERDANGYVIGSLTVGGTDNDGYHHTATIPIKIGNVPNTFITSGTLTSDTTYWCGNITLTGSITVPSSSVLNVDPGAVIKFPSNASLIVNGKLDAMGCTFEPVSGTSANSWGNIQLNGSGTSGSTIEYANINYGNGVQVINNPNFEISNSEFLNNQRAIYISGSTGSIINNHLTSNSNGHSIYIENYSTVTCDGNNITKTGNGQHQGSGIQYNASSGNVINNDISYCNWGIGSIWSSYVSSHLSSASGKNNRIRNCLSGIVVYRLGIGNFGTDPNSNYIWNSIYNNSYNVSVGMSYTTYASYLYAWYDWWGNPTPNTSLFSVGPSAVFQYTGYLTSDPWVGIPKVTTGNNKISSTQTNTSQIQDASLISPQDTNSIFQGENLRVKGDYMAAKDFFISYIRKHPDMQEAYVELYNCYNKETENDLIKFFTSLPSKASKDHKLLLSYLYLKKGDIMMAKKIDNEIIAENPNTSLATKANINNLYISLYNEDNLTDATTIFRNIIKRPELSTPSELSDIDDAIESYARIHNKTIPNFQALKKEVAIAINQPEDYELLGNYPNPFNPSTTISYTLPRTSEVELNIYDILGNKIKSFTIPSQSTGRQGIVWNGTNSNNEPVASGIYLYHFKAVSLEGNNETFEKTAKLLLIK